MNRILTRAGLLGAVTLSLGGCGMLYTLDVTASKRAADEPGKSYIILSGDPSLPVDSQAFHEYAAQLERALAREGYQRLGESDIDKAALGVYVAADIGGAAKEYHTVNRAVYESPYTPEVTRAARATATRGATSNQGGRTGTQTTVLDRNLPETLAGYEENKFATTVFTKHLTLVAVDLQQYLGDIAEKGRDRAVPKEIWSVSVETTGTPADLSDVVPVMIAASQPYVGESTGEAVTVKLSEGDRRVRQIRGQ